MPPRPLPIDELREVLTLAHASFEDLRSARIFITGGTGFFGHWLLESLLHADDALNLGLQVSVLTRNPGTFRSHSPQIAGHPAVRVVEGDVRSFRFPSEPQTHIVHAATDSAPQANAQPAYALAESILEGTRRVLQFATETGARRLLYVSSGAVYGRNVTGITHIPETYTGAPDPLLLQSSYDEAKRMAEHLCVAYTHGTSTECAIARCFAFVGPHLPLDGHFAIGNFIRDALENRPLHIRGDGTPLRSFLYMTDLAAWLWTMLVRAPANRAYNVGSEDALSIRHLAERVAATLRPGLPIHLEGSPNPSLPPTTYVPNISRARNELGLSVSVELNAAICRTAAWHSFRSRVT
jgi:dTDP-glucose 4,6-dehydratase